MGGLSPLFSLIRKVGGGGLRVLLEILSFLATLALWTAEQISGWIVQACRLVMRLTSVVLNLIVLLLQTLITPFAGLSAAKSSQQIRTHALRRVGYGVLAFFLASQLPALLPARMDNPFWYLAICRSVAGNGVILLFALFSLILALAWGAKGEEKGTASKRAIQIGWSATSVFLLMIPLQVISSLVVVDQIRTTSRQQLSTVETRREQAVREIASLNDPTALVAVFRRFAPPPRTQPSTALPLPQLRQEVAMVLSGSADLAKQDIQRQRRTRLLTFAVDGVRLLISFLALAWASLSITRWAQSLKTSEPLTEAINS